jgi:hypothetical protein
MSPSAFIVEDPPAIKFTGRVIRFEPDGFGIVMFDYPIGPSSNTLGIVTSSTTAISPLSDIRPGVNVEGTASADEHNVASIKEFRVVSSSST